MNYLYLIIILLISFFNPLFAENSANKIKFLLGQFKPEKHSEFVNLKQSIIPVARDNLYLKKEVVEQLEKLYKQLKHDIPDAKFWITSATRSYWHQKQIWEKKWEKYKKLYKHNNQKIAQKILEYSSMPGTSRHHWGTDFDINILQNDYYNKDNGKKIYEWLKKNAMKYGFCMPYNEGRLQGYQLEKWHWSYYKLAKQYQKEWNQYFKNNYFDIYIDFKGKEFFKKYAYIYVNSINEECK
ncbi:MAG: D-alanyl-D-alanine carboxypeptidase [Leptospiraceae bacterium]|nr:MAG: D-alanyl-D-alanine carboxypeptidase [Leptospiraceae bacterium]